MHTLYAALCVILSLEIKAWVWYWLRYCHYVAGLVGIGLSQLFASADLESPEFGNMEGLSNHMGLFLQKTNIIRDYLEDINEVCMARTV